MIEKEIQRIARLLEALVKVEKVPVRELERRLGLGGGTLNRIFSGRIELKLRHVLLVLGALGVQPGAFFRYAFTERSPEEDESSAWVLAAVKDLLRHDAPPEVAKGDLRRMIADTLAEMGIPLPGASKPK